MNNAEYWARRMRIVNEAIYKQTDDYIKNLVKQFNTVIKELDTKIRAWYQRFADNNGKMSYGQAQRMLTTGELKEFKWDVWEYIEKAKESAVKGNWIKELENASARVHISRLESIKMQLRQQAEMLTKASIDATTDASSLAYTESYYHTAYEIQRGIGVGWTMQGVNASLVEKILSRPWTTDNRTFTARCWTNKLNLVETVNRELIRMAATGAAPDRAIANIAKQFNVSKANAGRVVMTESAHFQLEAQKNCYKELGVEEYQIDAGLDTETCDFCGSMDGKVFKMSEYQEGVNAPLFHPRCRCATTPYFDYLDGGTRYARDAKTGKGYHVPEKTTYAEWKEMQDAKYGEGTVEKERKKRYNQTTDKVQHARYRSLFGNEIPRKFSDFQALKYDNPELWESYKTIARSKNYLQQKLSYEWNGEKCFIPKQTKFEKVVTMAGKGADTPIRCVDRLVETYGGKVEEWQKRAGKVTSDKYIFDLHWYESDGVQYEVKLKNRKERTQNEN